MADCVICGETSVDVDEHQCENTGKEFEEFSTGDIVKATIDAWIIDIGENYVVLAADNGPVLRLEGFQVELESQTLGESMGLAGRLGNE